MTKTVATKGQATIPKAVRDRLGLQPGSRVDFDLAPDGRVVPVKHGEGAPASRFGGTSEAPAPA
jgi:AbrB family looped-hinge helix DNA binding protein